MSDSSYETAQSPTDPNAYFVNQYEDLSAIERKRKISNIFRTIQYFAVKIWPSVNKVIETIVYFLIGLIRAMVKIAIDQIKNFKR